MKTFVVDTNVAVVANSRNCENPKCVSNCVQALHKIMSSESIALDDGWRVIKEYLANLDSKRAQPQVGDRFLKWVLINKNNPERCIVVKLTAYVANGATHFSEFPAVSGLNELDINDRKFVAVAAAHPSRPPILQAADSKWWGYKKAFADSGIDVVFVCEDDIEKKFSEKMHR